MESVRDRDLDDRFCRYEAYVGCFVAQKQAITTKVANYITKNLLHTEFNHEEPQKEQVLYEW